MQRTIPMLFIESYKQATDFYVDWLGFQIDWEYRYGPEFPVYMQVSRDGLLLHLTEHKGDNPPGIKCHVDVDDIQALIDEWNAKRPEAKLAFEIAPWKSKLLRLIDPFGNELGINEAPDEAC